MALSIEKRKLRAGEINVLAAELRQYPHIGWVSPSGWKKFGEAFVATIGGEFVGVFVPNVLSQWIKLGPLVIAGKFQGKGYGKELFGYVVDELREHNLYIGSSNPAVGRLALRHGFRKEAGFFRLPAEIQRYLIVYFISRLNVAFLLYELRKRIVMKRERYWYYLRDF